MKVMWRRFGWVVMGVVMGLGLGGCGVGGRDTLTQVATIDALLAGVYDGHVALGELRRHGDFGIGTFAGLDGEMVLLDGRFYQVRADGRVYRPGLGEKTPFASVMPFRADLREELPGGLDMKGLEAWVDGRVPEPNRFLGMRVDGEFRVVRTRSVPAQSKPYRPLVEVTRQQPEFELANVRGTLMGYRAPAFVKGVNVPGYHLHFLAADRSGGGHVLAFEMVSGTLQLDESVGALHIRLPGSNAAFAAADLGRDRGAELHAVEKQRRTDY